MTRSSAGGVISQFVSKKKKNNVLNEDEQLPFLSNTENIDMEDDCNSQEPSTSTSLDKKFLNIDGMTCGACSAMIQKLLSSLDGVESCSVSLLLKRAEVIMNPLIINLDDIIEEIEDIGFNASELLISSENKNNFTIELFYSLPIDVNIQQQISDILMTIEGISTIEYTSESIHNKNISSNYSESQRFITSDFNINMNNNNNIYSIHINITYDPNTTGMRTITEWINHKNHTNYKCKIIFDASDISQRKKNIQQSREREMLQWTRLFKYSLLFAVPAFLLTMIFPFFSGFSSAFNIEFIHGCSIHDAILFLLATPIQFGPPGILFYRGAYKSLFKSGSANMDVLVALATSISYFFSIIQILICIIDNETSPNTTFETSAVLITVIILGKYMETIAKGKTSQALDKLMDLAPSVARLVENWDENNNIRKIREIDARLIQLNDILEVPRGSKCPCDGIIIFGASSLDESLITGESMSVHKEMNDEIIGATVNLSNTIYIRVNKIGNETVLSKIITLVENAQSSRAPIQNLADIIASKFVPIVICISFIVFIGWYIGFETNSISIHNTIEINSKHSNLYHSFLFGISVLVISCPCALGLATPTAVMVATGKAAELGVLFKGGEPLEIVGKTNHILFDKTGTLTQGKMQIISVIKHMTCENNISRDDMWNYIYGSEKQSEHLIANAICNFIEGNNNHENINYQNENEEEEEENKYEYSLSEGFKNLRDLNLGFNFQCKYWTPEQFIPHSGLGVTAIYKNGIKVLIGNMKYMHQYNVKYKKFARFLMGNDDDSDSDSDSDSDDDDIKYNHDNKYISIIKNRVESLEQTGNTCVFISINLQLVCILSIADKIKSDAKYVINYLENQLNISCYMITGDNEITANAIGAKIGIKQENIKANVSPSNKQNIVKQLQNTHNMKNDDKNIVAFVGDGINDSPSLAQSDVGIAIGCGTDVAIASASVVLINSKLIDVLKTIDISKATVKRIRMNFGWALIYNMCMIPFAAGILYPFIHYALPPFMAGLLMCLSSISVVCNSLMLKLYQPPKAINSAYNSKFMHSNKDSLLNSISINNSWKQNKYNSYD